MSTLKTVERDVLGTEFVVVALTSDYNLLGDTVKIALVTEEDQDTPNWLTSSAWVAGQTWTDKNTVLYAEALVGPNGDFTLERGVTYTVKARVSDAPETPVIPCYRLKAV